MNYRTMTEAGSVPLIVAVVLAGGAMGSAQFVSGSIGSVHIANVPFPTSVPLGAPLKGQAAAIYDPQAGKFLYALNEERQLPLASLTKVMTAATVLSLESPEKRVRITVDALRPYGDSGLNPGDVWSLGNLVKFALVASSNDAIAAAAASAGAENILTLMNEEARRLGLVQTYFLDPTGLDLTPSTAGAYGSARDMALLMAAFLKRFPEILEVTARDGVPIGHAREATSTSVPIHDTPGLIGAKTGYTELAGGNLVVAFDADIGRPLIAVVLGSTEEGRFEDMRVLIESATAAVAASTRSGQAAAATVK